MAHLVLLRGLPASGKTTFARNWVAQDPQKRVRVNRDDLRFMNYGFYHGLTFDQEQDITRQEHSLVRSALKAGKDVIVDATNLKLKFARAFADIAVEMGAEFHVADMEAGVNECVSNDYTRGNAGGRHVGEHVIRSFAQRYKWPWPKVEPTPRSADTPPTHYEPDPSKPGAVICDLDGTLARRVTDREFHGKGLERVYEDDYDTQVHSFVTTQMAFGRRVIFMSGRNEFARAETVRWLGDVCGFFEDEYDLFMRPDTLPDGKPDTRPDYIVKAELFDKHVRDHYNVRMALDDRNQIVNLWRGMGIPCWQVADGNF